MRASPDGPSAGGRTDEAAGPGGERGRGGGGEGTDGTHDDGGGPAGSRAAGWERRSPRGAGEVSGEAGRCHCEERDGGRAGERGKAGHVQPRSEGLLLFRFGLLSRIVSSV